MSPRVKLNKALEAALEDPFAVLVDPPTSAARFPGRVVVCVQRAGITPSPVMAGWANALAVYLLVPHEAYAAAEEALDEHLPTLVAAIEAEGLPIVSMDRDVFFDQGESPGWHGYRVLTTAHTTNP